MNILPVKLPDVGEGVTEAELAEWYVDVGDIVQEDDVIAAVMTDKASVEIPSLYSGKVVQLGGEIGQVLPVGSDLVLIETDASAPVAGSAASQAVAPSQAPTPKAQQPSPGADKPARAQPQKAAMSGAPRAEGQAPLASPSVRARARKAGVDLRRVAGSGPAGRITHNDLDGVFEMPLQQPGQQPRQGRAFRTGTEEIKVVGMRRKIAERLALANSRIPHITVVEEVDVTALEELRATLNAGRGEKPKLTVLPFVAATLAKAFLDHPEMNAHYLDDDGIILRHGAVNVGMATMTDSGLVVPVLRHVEALSLFDTAAEIARLSKAARTSKATREELTGSTFTITSLGPLGALATTPIINHPEVAILGINKMATRPMWDGTQFVPRKMMNISASFDHRVIDGWDAAVFVQRIKTLLETPAMIFLEE
ncbi:Lipoamide acyltransferase component of branched-chain alpha-keto acid dehydrogenase complex [Pelagimonas phthalicica]|uniref:Dihydrolipoamide acetyltransferase component of pyruvate dehydrogenase complex n=1 Tax=Pelagimonas phthalicica TaxID=1037362 RepID=A0A238JG87_9RHOB|nr:dihydrolipoamide acetyltransferase family protein [Pelagimonas phthalicica]TDS92155.1 branched-chain alpha-keto acid dehydrogenase E2 component [Pelagimonas phthalicica]SMX29214.1 Lipoamide acyltransferase component of branched-chain alpha-keto acid dehydrogenase complex [Pelagimonas phthalicica]